jgi:hypothetical protein
MRSRWPTSSIARTSVPVGSRMLDATGQVANRLKNFPLRLDQEFLRCVADYREFNFNADISDLRTSASGRGKRVHAAYDIATAPLARKNCEALSCLVKVPLFSETWSASSMCSTLSLSTLFEGLIVRF